MSDKKNDELGDKLKALEMKYAGEKLDENLPICIRIDGKSFHTFTKGLKRPYDERLSNAMIETMNFLMDKSDARLGYTQSDEISLVLFKTASYQQGYFGSRVQKLTSILASMATAKFNDEVSKNISEKKNYYAFFDCRAFNVPSLKEAAEVFMWRQEDAIKNAITMAASSEYSHKQLHKKSSREKIQLLIEKNVEWSSYPEFFKSGTFAIKRYQEIPMTEDMKKYKTNEGKDCFLRSEIVNFHHDRLKHKDNLENVLFSEVFENHQTATKERNIRKKITKPKVKI